MNLVLPKAGRVSAMVLLAVLAACETDLTSVPDVTSPQYTIVPGGAVRLIKYGPLGSTATFSISAPTGTFPLGNTVTLDACELNTPCEAVVVWEDASDGLVENVTITETAHTGDLVLEQISVFSEFLGTTYGIFWPATPTITVIAGNGYNATVRFKNTGEPPDDLGNAGCTPGFWKQSQHFQYWTAPYTPSTAFGSVFADAFPGMSLLQVLQTGGGGLIALGRHTVAALLNAASPNVDYGMTTDEVISAFNAAYASGEYESQHLEFEALNERGCTAKVR